MLTLLVVLAVRAVIVLAVLTVVVGVGLLVRRRLRRTGRWSQVQQLVHTSVVPRMGGTPVSGTRSMAVRMLHRWLDGGTNR